MTDPRVYIVLLIAVILFVGVWLLIGKGYHR